MVERKRHDPLCPDVVLKLPSDCRICVTIDSVRKDERDKVAGSAVWQITFDDDTSMAYLWTTPEELLTPTNGLTVQRDAYLDINAKGQVTGIEIFDWPGQERSNGKHRFDMESEFGTCRKCGALVDTIYRDGIHWFKKEGDNG